jgi:pyrophosphatase PpaX
VDTSAVMFDWDGVLIDSLDASFRVYNRIFAKFGIRELTKDEFLRYQSPNWDDFYLRIGLPKKFWKEADDDWPKLYEREKPTLHHDARRCLTTLKDNGLGVALVSNGSRDRINKELDRFRLRRFFDSLEFGVKKAELKPSPRMLERTLARLDLKPSNALYVGDSPADIQAAKNAKVPSVALARGPIQAERLGAEKPDYMFSDLDAVTGLLVK